MLVEDAVDYGHCVFGTEDTNCMDARGLNAKALHSFECQGQTFLGIVWNPRYIHPRSNCQQSVKDTFGFSVFVAVLDSFFNIPLKFLTAESSSYLRMLEWQAIL